MAGVLVGLALICLFFPPKGIQIGSWKLEFPSLQEVLEVKPKVVQESPEEILRKRQESLRNAQLGKFDNFFKNDPARITFPNNDAHYFDSFFEALEQSGKKHVRIMHYADSQIEEDRMTATLRHYYQDEFGGNGVGMLTPVEVVPMMTMLRNMTPELPSFVIYAYDKHGNKGKYGPMGASTHLSGSVHYTLTSCQKEKYPHSAVFNKVSVLMSGTGSMTAKVREHNVPLTLEKEVDGMKQYSAQIPAATRCQLTITGEMDLYSILLDSPTGVNVDNIPMRGCSGNIFTLIARKSFAPYFQLQNVGLIILQYGGNSVPYTETDEKIEAYMKQLSEQIALFKQMAPKAKILFIGPADMSTLIRGSYKTYPQLPKIDKALRQMANASGAAYWSLFDAMGGEGTMAQMVNVGFATHDYVHFSVRGAEKMAGLLCNTLQVYHDAYRIRTGRQPLKHQEVRVKEGKPLPKPKTAPKEGDTEIHPEGEIETPAQDSDLGAEGTPNPMP